MIFWVKVGVRLLVSQVGLLNRFWRCLGAAFKLRNALGKGLLFFGLLF
jgi:hypothetical protein